VTSVDEGAAAARRAEAISAWGPEDQKGAMNLLTPAHTLAALQSVREGRIVDLSHELKMGHPCIPFAQVPFFMSLALHADDTRRLAKQGGHTNDFGCFTERAELCMHSGTHIDALGHFTIGEEMYNGWSYRDSVNARGLERLGIEQMPPLVGRAVLLDVAGIDGGEHLEGGRVITSDELKRARDRAGVEIAAGDTVLIRTGYGRYFQADPQRYIRSEPGIDVEAARWLTEQKVAVIGTDTMAVEVLPNPDPKLMLPVHQHTLVEAGVHLIENLTLDDIAREGAGAFCFVLLAVKFTGATGCPVRPVAIL
jgi:kynurenine formamidase